MEQLLGVLRTIKPEVDFENNKTLVDDGILDSLDIVEIISEIEEQFSIMLDPAQIDPDNFQSADDMWQMILEIQKSNH